MNRGALNGFALNGRSADPVVRIRVDVKGYARVRAGGRVLAYAVVQSAPAAALTGPLGRVHAKLSADALARAAVEGALGRIHIRSLLAATGRAIIKVTLPPVRGRVAATARASAAVTAHVLARNAVATMARADFAPQVHLLRRGPVQSSPEARGAADGRIYVRRWLRSPVDGKGQAFIVSQGRVEARLSALIQARAAITARGQRLARAPLQAQGVAFIEIDPAIHKRLPFDEQAPESRTFLVPAGMTTFYVTDQGQSMFRASPMQPADTQDYDIEFADWFPPGDEIVSVQLKVQPAMPMPPSFAFVGQRVKVWIYAGGASGQKYQISVAATTNDGRTKEVELIVPIKEK
ncbi:phage fiber-tail adaptor protein [Delftia lacustris]|uniref:phage fiber-tail adaptor protein n=1 Tax=Delftia lacustris TaxID=558537 RepID=UPI002865CBAD|nr:hypothetical protein [Delftia lacustris]MDR6729335.1 hypothetical protein [Delftia lacustris]